MPLVQENHAAREALLRLADATPLQPASPPFIGDKPVARLRVVTFRSKKSPTAVKSPEVEAVDVILSHSAATGIATLSKLFLFELKRQNTIDPNQLRKYEESLRGALETQISSFEAMQASIRGVLLVAHHGTRLKEFQEAAAKLSHDLSTVVQAVVDGCQGLADDLPASDPLTPARLRGAQYRNTVLQKEEMLSGHQAAELLGVSRQSITDKRHAGQLFALSWGKRSLKYPPWQFEPEIFGEPLRKVLEPIKGEDPWSIYRFFLAPDPRLGDKTPLDVLRSGDVNRAVAAATRFADRD